ncbi:MAG TPA: hypothetical protein VMG12_16670, partial [Polyangiaceae bacterium]|nr:hypothetical protein [Polyangiaceae bacterium]
YRAEAFADMPLADEKCAQLAAIGKEYRLALELAESKPGSMGRRAAWHWAEKATAALGEFVANSPDLGVIVGASAARLRQPTSRKSSRG